jgi:hypothetical protein
MYVRRGSSCARRELPYDDALQAVFYDLNMREPGFIRTGGGRSVEEAGAESGDSLPSSPGRAKVCRVRARVRLGANRRDHGLVVGRVRDRFRRREV